MYAEATICCQPTSLISAFARFIITSRPLLPCANAILNRVSSSSPTTWSGPKRTSACPIACSLSMLRRNPTTPISTSCRSARGTSSPIPLSVFGAPTSQKVRRPLPFTPNNGLPSLHGMCPTSFQSIGLRCKTIVS